MFVALSLFSGIRMFFCAAPSTTDAPQPIDQKWWDELSEEWKTIFRINQYFQKHQVDFSKVQEEYLNRLNGSADDPYTELNTSLRNLHEKRTFQLSYQDMYARVRKKYPAMAEDTIDLKCLPLLDKIYMVSGPGDLSPLERFPNLKMLVINYCGIKPGKPFKDQELDLTPIQHLKQLTQLYCSSPTLQSIEPLKNLNNLLVLDCYNTNITSLEPLKNLRKLEILAIDTKLKNITVLTRLPNLQELIISGFKQMPNLATLKNLKKLTLIENELALVNKSYQLKDLHFLSNSMSLEYLDFELTSYRGRLNEIKELKALKAITLPRISSTAIPEFKQSHPDCKIINYYEFE